MGSISNNLKLLLISTGVLSIAMALKLTVPLLPQFIVSGGPSLSSFLLTWLTPPYLYILVNCIILSILASSKFHHHSPSDETSLLSPEAVKFPGGIPPEYAAIVGSGRDEAVPLPDKTSACVPTDCCAYSGVVSDGYGHDANSSEKSLSNSEITNRPDENILTATPSGGKSLQRNEPLDFAFPIENEKPLASARVGHRENLQASPEGPGPKGVLGIAKPKIHDSLESTWKTRHLRKSNTWDSQTRRHEPLSDHNAGRDKPPKLMKKSETFTERSKMSGRENASPPSPGGKLASLSQDELNRRVEAFIKKFNDEMRLQRQESLRQYL